MTEPESTPPPKSPNRVYDEITGKPLTHKIMDWIHDLEERYGEERLIGAMEAIASTGKLDRFLEQVSKRLASHAAMARGTRTPPELDRETILAMVRGEISEPDRPYTMDCSRLLKSDEYGEVIAWAAEGQRRAVVG